MVTTMIVVTAKAVTDSNNHKGSTRVNGVAVMAMIGGVSIVDKLVDGQLKISYWLKI